MAEPVLMMSETANTDLVDVSPDCREQICCDSLLPALAQEQVWLAGYSRLKTCYRIARRFADVHCFLQTLGGEGEVQVEERPGRVQVGADPGRGAALLSTARDAIARDAATGDAVASARAATTGR